MDGMKRFHTITDPENGTKYAVTISPHSDDVEIEVHYYDAEDGAAPLASVYVEARGGKGQATVFDAYAMQYTNGDEPQVIELWNDKSEEER